MRWLLAACQGIDFRRPLRSSDRLESAHALLRSAVSHYGADRYFAPDIAATDDLIANDVFTAFLNDPFASAA